MILKHETCYHEFMRIFRNYFISIVTGILVGILTAIGQKYLPMNLNFLANSGAMWLIPGALIPYLENRHMKHAIAVSITCLFGCLIGYYVYEAFMNEHALYFTNDMILWSGCAVVGGVICGIAAYISQNNTGFLKYLTRNLLSAFFLSEGLTKVFHISEYQHMIPSIFIEISIGIILYVVINRKESFQSKSIFSILLLSALGFIFYEIIFFATIV